MEGHTLRRRGAAVAIASLGCLCALAASAGAVTAVKPLKLKPAALKSATATVPYAATLSASGGTAPYTFSVQSGSLPEGLTLSPEGAITGTPATAGASSFTIEVSDSSAPARTASISYSLPVQLDVTPSTLHRVSAFTTGLNVPLGAAGGSGSYSFSLAEGSLPPGVEIYEGEEEFHALSGTAFSAGTYEFAIQATDKHTGVTGVRRYRLKVSLGITPESGPLFPDAVVGEPYYTSFDAVGGSHYTYEIVEGHLPEGLVLGQEENVATITGTPGKAEQQKITVLDTDTETGLTVKAKYKVTVRPFGFPKGIDSLEEKNPGGEFLGRDTIFFELTREHAGVATGRMEDGDGSTGTWTYTVASRQLVFNWPEIAGTGGFRYEGTCATGEQKCEGTDPQGTWVLTAFS